jgi:hypothetical protein
MQPKDCWNRMMDVKASRPPIMRSRSVTTRRRSRTSQAIGCAGRTTASMQMKRRISQVVTIAPNSIHSAAVMPILNDTPVIRVSDRLAAQCSITGPRSMALSVRSRDRTACRQGRLANMIRPSALGQ